MAPTYPQTHDDQTAFSGWLAIKRLQTHTVDLRESIDPKLSLKLDPDLDSEGREGNDTSPLDFYAFSLAFYWGFDTFRISFFRLLVMYVT